MAMVYHTAPDTPAQADRDQTDLVRRYCPGLDTHPPTTIARYIPHDPTVCWPWGGRRDTQGYGLIATEPTPYGFQRAVHVHRYLFDCLVGAIDIRNDVHHRCENKPCWNWFHLEEVTPKDHKARHRRRPARPVYPCDARGQFLLFAP